MARLSNSANPTAQLARDLKKAINRHVERLRHSYGWVIPRNIWNLLDPTVTIAGFAEDAATYK